jgi:SOS-response transcriptional repressor LexA
MPAKKLGRPPTGATKTKKSVTIDINILDAAENAASEAKISLSSVIEAALERYLETNLPVTASVEDRVQAFPEIVLLHAAAGQPVSADEDTYVPTREVGPNRFAVQLHGDSMSPKYPDGSVVILRERDSLSRPLLKKGEVYLFDLQGEKTLKAYGSRVATKDEIAKGLSYVSPADGKTKVHVLKSLNPKHPEIIVAGEAVWLGWLDKADNK